MLNVAVCLCFFAGALAAPADTDVVPLEKQQPTVIPIVSQSDELEPNGTYHFSYETGNGIKMEESSYSKIVPRVRGLSTDSNEGGEDSGSDEIHVQMGSYSYTAPDGTVISVRYIADENGFQPIGDHIPRVPSVSISSSGEKSGRALNVADSASSASSPAAAKAADKSSVAVPLSSGVIDAKSAASAEATSTAAPEASGEASTKSAEAEAPSTVAAAAPTTEAASTVASAEKSETTVAPSSAEASTTAAA
ncbi:insect cuticle protein domain-containing protein [Phthorimaea operculella]|nr:insect cuticle protein domain-containing protein [Phthorimaea operculella]